MVRLIRERRPLKWLGHPGKGSIMTIYPILTVGVSHRRISTFTDKTVRIPLSDILPILTFHGIDRFKTNISISPELFRRGITKLHAKGYRTLDLKKVVTYLTDRKPFPDQSVVLTFDDGYKSVYDEAFPVLKNLGLTAIVFLRVGKTKGIVGDRLPTYKQRDMLRWDEISEMQKAGIRFGAHTLTHPILTRLSLKEAEKEILESRSTIEDVLKEPVCCFAYPYGRYNEQIKEMVQNHFTCACSDQLNFVTIKSDPYSLERIDAYYLRKRWMFDIFFRGVFRWYIKSCSIPRQIRRFFQPSPAS